LSKGRLVAGAAKTDITPSVGTPSEYGETTGVDLPLFTRALVLTNGKETVAVSSNDLIYIDQETVTEARRRTSEKTGIPGGNIMFCASHTHEGPVTYQGTKPAYLADRVTEALCCAWESRREARIGAAKGQLVGVTINRRNPYGPADPDLGVMRVDDAQGKPMAMLFNFACHGVVLGHHRYHGISPDWPGHAEHHIEQLSGEKMIALFANGPCANINPYTSIGYTGFTDMGGDVNDVDRIGNLVALHATIISNQIQTTEEARLTSVSMSKRLRGDDKLGPRKRIEALIAERTGMTEVLRKENGESASKRVARAEKDIEYLKAYYEVLNEAARKSTYLDLDKTVENPQSSEIQVIGVNDIRLVGVPGECFTEYGLYIKERALAMGFKCTFVAELTNGGWWGYIPTQIAFDELGYEALNALAFTGLSQKAGETIADAALELIAKTGQPEDPAPKPFVKRPLPRGHSVNTIKPLARTRMDRLSETLPYHHEIRARKLEDIQDP
jgi:hypothetical protein